jgi:hypothetical protein
MSGPFTVTVVGLIAEAAFEIRLSEFWRRPAALTSLLARETIQQDGNSH